MKSSVCFSSDSRIECSKLFNAAMDGMSVVLGLCDDLFDIKVILLRQERDGVFYL
jgi:hypothetical protein